MGASFVFGRIDKLTTATSTPAAGETRSDPNVKGAWAAVLISVLTITFAAPVIRATLNAGMPSLAMAGMRLGLAWLLLTPLVLTRYRGHLRALDRRSVLLAVMAGVLMALHFVTLAVSLDYTRIIVTQTLVNTAPLWTAVLETRILRARLPRVVWIGLALALVGSSVIALSGIMAGDGTLIAPPDALGLANGRADNVALGAGFALVSALGAASYLTTGRRARADVPLIPYIWLLYGTGAVVGWIVIGATRTPVANYDPMAYVWLMAMVLGPQLLGHSGFNYALKHIPATIISLSTQFISVGAPVVAFFIFTEVPTALEVTGSAVIVCGVVIAIIGQNSHRQMRLRRVAAVQGN